MHLKSKNTANAPLAFVEETVEASPTGALIINADDWGRDRETTERIFECILSGTVSSTSAMVFMADSERAAARAREAGVDAGLHLNLTTPFSAPNCPPDLLVRQRKLTRYLRRHSLAQVVFHPGLMRSFEYVVNAQLDEFRRLYDAEPARLDGHHHMHLCANVVLGGLLPSGTIARRTFSFRPGEKGLVNRKYRQLLDRVLARRHRLTDFLFALPPLDSGGRLQRIFDLARRFIVEVETHPINANEYQFLMTEKIHDLLGDIRVARGFSVDRSVAWKNKTAGEGTLLCAPGIAGKDSAQ